MGKRMKLILTMKISLSENHKIQLYIHTNQNAQRNVNEAPQNSKLNEFI